MLLINSCAFLANLIKFNCLTCLGRCGVNQVENKTVSQKLTEVKNGYHIPTVF